MKIEKQVTSLELSKKLKELGVPQESYFLWVSGEFSEKGYRINPSFVDKANRYYLSAFSVAELGELLPKFLEKKAQLLTIRPDPERGWNAHYIVYDFGFTPWKSCGETLADTLANMLIHLIESNLLKL